jgi:hypothetical protein
MTSSPSSARGTPFCGLSTEAYADVRERDGLESDSVNCFFQPFLGPIMTDTVYSIYRYSIYRYSIYDTGMKLVKPVPIVKKNVPILPENIF